MHICILSENYPNNYRSIYPFVEQLVNEFASIDEVECTVISPFSVTHYKRFSSKKEIFVTVKGAKVTIFRPNVITLSNLKIADKSISFIICKKAIYRTLKKLDKKPDIIYCHFWSAALMGYKFAKENDIPLFVATGESVIPPAIANSKNRDALDYVRGVICVSTKNKDESIHLGLTDETKCRVIPNAIDKNRFKLLDKPKIRKSLGISDDDFVVAFVGGFIHRKGPDRVSDAIQKLNDPSIKSIFIGAGPINPNCKGMIFCGKLRHNEICNYLNAANVFVLPTLNEGCCNAIIEAMACGLPIISSNLSFNLDILNESNSILIDPNNINDISAAIKRLHDNRMELEILQSGAIKTANDLNIENRARKILDFISMNI